MKRMEMYLKKLTTLKFLSNLFFLSKNKDVVKQLLQNGGKAIFLKADQSKAKDVESAIKATESHFGKINVLFNNAGIMHSNDDDAVSTDEAVWDLTMNVNLKGVFLGCKYGIPALR